MEKFEALREVIRLAEWLFFADSERQFFSHFLGTILPNL